MNNHTACALSECYPPAEDQTDPGLLFILATNQQQIQARDTINNISS